MRQSRLRRPSPALVVSFLALFAALGGGAYAAGTSDTKTDKKIATTAARSYFNSHINGASVSHASSANSASTARTATNATNAANAQPVAFAHVTGAGVLDTANSKNVGSVTKEAGDFYCLSGIPFTPKGGQATVDYLQATGFEFAQFAIGNGGCPSDTQAYVLTESSTAAAPAGFYVVLYG